MSDFTLNYGQAYTIESTVTSLQTSGGLGDFTLLVFTGKADLSDPDANAVFQKKLTSGAGTTDIQIITPGNTTTDGVAWLLITHADYAKLAPGVESTVIWDFWAVDAQGKPYLLDSGTLTVLAHATQAVS